MSFRHGSLRQKVCEQLVCTDQSSFHIEFDRMLCSCFFFGTQWHPSVQHPSCVSTRTRKLTFQRELSRGGLCATNWFPRFKSQRTTNLVGGWCSCFVCAPLHQSVRHSRRTDSMSRGLAFQRGLLPRALCEEHEGINEFSLRLVSPFDIHQITRLAFS